MWKWKIYHLWIFLLIARCSMDQDVSPSGIGREDIGIIGHGGGGYETTQNWLPPNTLQSVEKAIFTEGADGVEIDIRFTKDGAPVLYHDNFLESRTNCSGCVQAMDLFDVIQCKFTSTLGGTEGDYYIRSLHHMLSLLQNSKVKPKVFLDIKTFNACSQSPESHRFEEFVSAIDELTNGYGWNDNIFLETVDTTFLNVAAQANTGMKLVYDCNDFELGRDIILQNGYDGLGIVNQDITKQEVELLQSEGKFVLIWGIKIKSDAKDAIQKLPEYIMTDDIRLMRNLLNR